MVQPAKSDLAGTYSYNTAFDFPFQKEAAGMMIEGKNP